VGSFNFFIDKISKFFIDKINKFCGCEQQPDGSINLQQASKLIFIGKVFITNRPASFVIIT
jgi:hypothetical protein